MSLRQFLVVLIGICLIPILSSACNKSGPLSTSTPTDVGITATITSSPEPTITPIPPTATPVPMAAIINGKGISLAEYQAELARFQASSTITGTILAPDTKTIVLNELIDQILLAQAAAENGFIVDDTMLQSRIDALVNQVGGESALVEWQAAHGYSSEAFKQTLKRSIAAAWMRDQTVAVVPQTADEVHVLQILVPTQAEADQIYASLQSGKDFLSLASSYEPITNGDLGWFPRGYLSQPAIEEAAFGLEPGEYSEVIKTDIGFHILYLVERDPHHPLSPDALKVLQADTMREWLVERREQSEIEILVP